MIKMEEETSSDRTKMADEISSDITKMADEISFDVTKMADEISSDMTKMADEISSDMTKMADNISPDMTEMADVISSDIATLKKLKKKHALVLVLSCVFKLILHGRILHVYCVVEYGQCEDSFFVSLMGEVVKHFPGDTFLLRRTVKTLSNVLPIGTKGTY